MDCFSVRRCLRDLPASRLQPAASFSANGSSLLGRSGTVNFGSIVPALRYFAMVLRDKPVRRLISRIDSLSRNAIRRMMFKSPMWITPFPRRSPRWGRFTWLNSQWKLCAYRLSSAWKTRTPAGVAGFCVYGRLFGIWFLGQALARSGLKTVQWTVRLPAERAAPRGVF